MYSVVMLMALTTGGETPAFGGRGCHGCSGCYGSSSCSGYSCGGSSGCHGCHGRRHRCHGCHGGGGCYGGYGCCGGGYVCGGSMCHGSSGCCGGTMTTPPATGGGAGEGEKKKEGRLTNAPATIVVSLPADARLSIEGQPTSATSSLRTFQSPTLPVGKEFYYTLKAEVTRDGQTLTATKQVSLRAGQESRVAMDFAASSVASR